MKLRINLPIEIMGNKSTNKRITKVELGGKRY